MAEEKLQYSVSYELFGQNFLWIQELLGDRRIIWRWNDYRHMEVLLADWKSIKTTIIIAWIFSLCYINSKIGKIKTFFWAVWHAFKSKHDFQRTSFWLILFNVLHYQSISSNLEVVGYLWKENLFRQSVLSVNAMYIAFL